MAVACSLLSLGTEGFSLSIPQVPMLSLFGLKAEEPSGLSHLHPYYLYKFVRHLSL